METDIKLKVSEIFYSLQGEGDRAGEPTIFVRLSGCSAKHACYASGVICDTEYESGKMMSAQDILEWADKNAPECRVLTWTGGEPTDQLTQEIALLFKNEGYYQTIETSGVRPVPEAINFVSLSPKVAEHILAKHFPNGVYELRYVRHVGQSIPEPSVSAVKYFLSPHSDGWHINEKNLKHCIQLCLENPKWRLSVQQHKLWSVL